MIGEALRERLQEYLPPTEEARRLIELALHRLPPSVTGREEEPLLGRIAEALGEYLLALWYESIPEVERDIALRLASVTPLTASPVSREELAKVLDAAEEILTIIPDSPGRSGCLRDIQTLRREPDVTRARALHGRLRDLLPPQLRAAGRREALSRSVHRMSLPLKMLARELPRYVDFLEESGMEWPATSLGWNPREGRWDPPDWDSLHQLRSLLSREPTVERLARFLSLLPFRSSSEQPTEVESDAPERGRGATAAEAEQATIKGSVHTPAHSPPDPFSHTPPATEVEGITLSPALGPETLYLLRRRGHALSVARSSADPESRRRASPAATVRDATTGQAAAVRDATTAQAAVGRGDRVPPLALVLDTTGSMRGEPEAVAKALAFGLLKHAVGRGRELRLLVFSTAVRSLVLEPEVPAVGELPRFLNDAFASGAAGVPALRQVLRQAQREGWNEAEILFVTDSREARLSPATVEQLTELRRRARLRLHGLSINSAPMINPENLFDFTWHYASSRTSRPGISSEQFRHI